MIISIFLCTVIMGIVVMKTGEKIIKKLEEIRCCIIDVESEIQKLGDDDG